MKPSWARRVRDVDLIWLRNRTATHTAFYDELVRELFPESYMTEQDKRNEEFYQELMQDDLYARYASNYLPHWADARLNGVPEQYAQLETRDGRKMGNGVVTDIINWQTGDGEVIPVYVVLTDFGNYVPIAEPDLDRYFFPPRWRMNFR